MRLTPIVREEPGWTATPLAERRQCSVCGYVVGPYFDVLVQGGFIADLGWQETEGRLICPGCAYKEITMPSDWAVRVATLIHESRAADLGWLLRAVGSGHMSREEATSVIIREYAELIESEMPKLDSQPS